MFGARGGASAKEAQDVRGQAAAFDPRDTTAQAPETLADQRQCLARGDRGERERKAPARERHWLTRGERRERQRKAAPGKLLCLAREAREA